MRTSSLSLAVASALAVLATPALSQPFTSFDPRSMAMGGAGVAVGNTATAPFFNPALLAAARENEDFAWEIPVVGGTVRDGDDLQGGIDEFQERDNITALDDAIFNYENNMGMPEQEIANLEIIADVTRDLSEDFQLISDRSLDLGLGAGTVIGMPGKSFSGALSVHAEVLVGGMLRYEDDSVLQNLASDVDAFAGCAEDNLSLPFSCDPRTDLNLTYIDPNTGEVLFDPNTDLKSRLEMRGVAVAEVGFSMAREFKLTGNRFAVGIKPKMVQVTVFDYDVSVNDADTGDFNGEDYTATYSDFNLDIGLAKQFDNGIRTGIVVKNVFTREYETERFGEPTGNIVTIKPQTRFGVSHQTDWTTVALDVDLAENDPIGLEDPTQYASLGLELNLFDWFQFRTGYRMDMVNSDRSLTSVGLGLAPFRGLLHVDLAVASQKLNEDTQEVGGALQLGMRF